MMKPEWGPALAHVALATSLCVAIICTGIFEGVSVQVGLEHYAEPVVASLPTFLAMPFNSLINMAYMLLGWAWLRRGPGGPKQPSTACRARYMQHVFASMALLYGPVQWLRIGTQARTAALLDQWVTLPIFAWPVAWCLYLDRGWQPLCFLGLECLSLCSYGLALLHPQGFELALAGHIAAALGQGLRTQQRHGCALSAAYLVLAVLSCLGFVGLKLCDHQLAHWPLFQRLTGHFWSKVCDVLQFHFAFLFLTSLSPRQPLAHAGKAR